MTNSVKTLSEQKVVFLVDDNELDRRLYRRVLTRGGINHPVMEFGSGDETLNCLLRYGCDNIELIFLDINMPRMNGFEFLEAAIAELGDEFKSGVVVMLTTSLDPKDQQRAQQFSTIKKYINKPLTVEDVKEVLHLIGKSEISTE